MGVITKTKDLEANLIQKRLYEVLADPGNKKTEDEIRVAIADELDITTRQLTYWCMNSSQPSLEHIFKIAQILKCTIDDLVI